MKPRTSKVRAEKATKLLKRSDEVLLRGNPKRVKQIVEFIDKKRPVMYEHYEVIEQFENQQISLVKAKTTMKRLIIIDDSFLDSYLFLAQIEYDEDNYEAHSRLLWQAYQKAMLLVANKDGNYPKKLLWGWHENRHIIRALSNFALLQWELGYIRLSLEIYRKLLASNLNDNIGARYSILAIRLGYEFDYEELFLPESGPIYGLDAIKINAWFTTNAPKFPGEFVDYFENAKQYE
jgi:hypothetical protein